MVITSHHAVDLLAAANFAARTVWAKLVSSQQTGAAHFQQFRCMIAHHWMTVGK